MGTLFPVHEGIINASQDPEGFEITWRNQTRAVFDAVQAQPKIGFVTAGLLIPTMLVANPVAHAATVAYAADSRWFAQMITTIPGSSGVPPLHFLQVKFMGHPAIQVNALVHSVEYAAFLSLGLQPLFWFSSMAPNSAKQRVHGHFVVSFSYVSSRADTRVALIGGISQDGHVEYMDAPLFGMDMVAQADLPLDLRALPVSFISYFSLVSLLIH